MRVFLYLEALLPGLSLSCSHGTDTCSQAAHTPSVAGPSLPWTATRGLPLWLPASALADVTQDPASSTFAVGSL